MCFFAILLFRPRVNQDLNSYVVLVLGDQTGRQCREQRDHVRTCRQFIQFLGSDDRAGCGRGGINEWRSRTDFDTLCRGADFELDINLFVVCRLQRDAAALGGSEPRRLHGEAVRTRQ